jgi:hypothetical protein
LPGPSGVFRGCMVGLSGSVGLQEVPISPSMNICMGASV